MSRLCRINIYIFFSLAPLYRVYTCKNSNFVALISLSSKLIIIITMRNRYDSDLFYFLLCVSQFSCRAQNQQNSTSEFDYWNVELVGMLYNIGMLYNNLYEWRIFYSVGNWTHRNYIGFGFRFCKRKFQSKNVRDVNLTFRRRLAIRCVQSQFYDNAINVKSRRA